MLGETPRRGLQKLREESQRKLREATIQLGENLLRSRGISLPPDAADRERIAQIEAYKDLIRSKTREIKEWTERRDHAEKRGMARQAQFRQQMTTGMENQLERLKEELRRLQSTPGRSGPTA